MNPGKSRNQSKKGIMETFRAVQICLLLASSGLLKPVQAALPPGYAGKPFQDVTHTNGAQVIPGRIECACYDLGGEGIAYHDTDPTNHGSGELNL